MNFNKFINSDYLKNNPLCGISTYKDELNLTTGACTRKIKKLVLDGTEGWSRHEDTGTFVLSISGSDAAYLISGEVTCMCTHYPAQNNTSSYSQMEDKKICMRANSSNIWIRNTDYLTTTDFKTYLQQQYAAGTPVCVWYVLATPTTETITVPSGLSGTEEGYLNQSGTPTPTNPIYPTANTVEKWFDINHYIMGTDTDTITTLPADIYANDSNATVSLKGDMEQSGTPTPTTPIQPSECGDLETTGEHTGQYKIPILSGGVTTPVYLGEVESTRRIKKLVLTGEEAWTYRQGEPSNVFFLEMTGLNAVNNHGLCTHYLNQDSGSFGVLEDKHLLVRFAIDGTKTFIAIRDTNFGLPDLKTYLAQQYAAGTPVCVWYVLATPQTAVVNEPLRKIGDYADTVSDITIPTIAGANTLSIDTTLQPSEVSVTYHGWHPVQSVHVYPDSSWMPTSWEEFRKAVRSGKAQSLYPVGTKLYENWGDTTSDAWIVVDYPTGEDYLDSDLAQQGYTNRVMLMEEKLNYLVQFDTIEAWLYVETAIPAGTYRFTIPNYDASYGGNKTYIFTSTANVPVGGQLTLTWAPNTNPTKVQGYSSSTSTSDLFNVTIAEWDGTTPCTDLGTIKLAMSDADSTYGKLNHIHRSRYSSNNYYQSGYRQWLNTNASANWWTPTNVFDRPYDNRTNAGRLNIMNSNMKSVLATPTVNCITNNLFEYPSLDGTTFSLQTAYTVKDKLFPVTHSEINLSSSPNVNSVLDYYVDKGNADRIKYRKDNGNAYYWWMRTPTPTNAHSMRIVYTSGALSGNTALSTGGSAAACIIQ